MADQQPSESSTSVSSTTKPRAAAKPRAGIRRKTAAEREEYARKEAERAKEKEVQEKNVAATTKPAVRGARGGARGGSGRGRGGAAGAVTRTSSGAAVPAGGVFGAGSGLRPERSKSAVDLGMSEALDGGDPKANAEALAAMPSQEVIDIETSAGGSGGGGGGSGGAGNRGRAAKGQAADQIISIEEDDREDRPRRDIEMIELSSDEEDEAITSQKGKQRRMSRTPKPFAGLRPVRAARTVVDERQEDDQTKHKTPAPKMTIDDAPIEVESDEMQVDETPGTSTVKKDLPSSPELSKRTLKKVDSRTRDPRLLNETIEEKAERFRLHEDIENMRDAFLHKSDTDDALDSKDEEEVFGRTDHDRMFLFQLPPLVPQLYDPAKQSIQNGEPMDVDGVQVKAEDGANSTALTADAAIKKTSQVDAAPQLFTAESATTQRFPTGLVGKLRIHKSGKVTMDWGGTDMEIRYGAAVDFLQDVICVEPPPAVAEGGEGKEGKAYAMGQIKNKMVCVPDWSRLYA